jgi:hypothetical protein
LPSSLTTSLFLGEQMFNCWVNVVLFAEKPTSKQFQQVLIVGGSESARFVTYSVENNQSECFAINIPTHSSSDASDIKVNSVECSLFNNDSPNFLSALWALHACSPPVEKLQSRAPALFSTGARLLLATTTTFTAIAAISPAGF